MSSSDLPADLRYTATHEWIRMDGAVATVGITDFAQAELSDVVWVELPEIGQTYETGQVAATVESVKAAADVYAPVSGAVIEVNAALTAQPEAVNAAPYDSWFFKIQVRATDPEPPWLTAQAYRRIIEAGR